MIAPTARLVDGVTGAQWTGERLTEAIDKVAATIRERAPGAVLCLMRNDAPSVLGYLGVLSAGRPALLSDPSGEVADLIDRFQPTAVLGAEPDGPPPARYRSVGGAWLREEEPAVAPHPDLRLLLATSGSTGRPRLVRQSSASVAASAAAIRAALRIEDHDVAITALPLFHTLGLSVVNSHLQAGATVVAEPRGVLDPGFWASVDRHGVTSLTGVPHTFELLYRLPWRPERNPTLRALCVSGGRLRDRVVTDLAAALSSRGGGFYVMYGQTEAGSRICVLPPDHLPAKVGSVGPPVPGTRLTIEDGEVVCHSASVMMGYADSAADLARGDELAGRLPTGDRGDLDADGHLWLTGRSGRIGKAFGVRVSLDAVEHVGSAIAPTAALAGEDRVLVWCEGVAADRLAEVAALVARELRIHRTAVTVAALPVLPRRPNGKVDYDALPV